MPLPRDPNQTLQPSKLMSVVVDVAEGADKTIHLEVAWYRCMPDDKGYRDNDGRQMRLNANVHKSLVRCAAIEVLRGPLVLYDQLGLTLFSAVVRERSG